jgi:alkylation response protein AidB-like acyl-CoA dehydrogenase
MANLLVDMRDQHFTLFEMLDTAGLTKYPKFQEYSKDMFEMVLSEAEKLAVNEIYPTNEIGDKEECKFENGKVTVPDAFIDVYKKFVEGGWVTVSDDIEVGGQGFPEVINACTRELFGSANFAFIMYPGLGHGAAKLIEIYGTEEQKRKYMDRMYAGEWCGTMCLTEPGAGSDVGALKTIAKPIGDGKYKIVGTKIFISAGDHNLTENIVHPVLARIEGAPAGTKGISIFLVPKYRVNDDGSLGEFNDIHTGNIEHKMGIKGNSTCTLNFGDNDDCIGELLGEENKGMRVMFNMMNEARLGVGLQGLAHGTAAYLHSVNYARERLQGSDLANFRNPDAPRVPIISHPDVRRMLLWMKAHVEGLRALMYWTAYAIDMSHCAEDEVEKEKWHGYVELLTPICKSWGSDIGFRITEYAIQVYGGYGYTSEYPVDQFMRDCKIASIYEGTNGIQALDLVARKLGQNKGANFMNFITLMNETVEKYKGNGDLKDLVEEVEKAKNTVAEMGGFFAQCGAEGKFLVPVGNAYQFLELMSIATLGWLLLWQAGIAAEKLTDIKEKKGVKDDDWAAVAELYKDDRDASYYQGKVAAAKFYGTYVLPHVGAIAAGIKKEDMSIMEIAESAFATI